MIDKSLRWFRTLNYPSYVVLFVTARCNANCKMCFYKDNMAKSSGDKELTVEEYEKISKGIKLINILGISGGEPFLRDDLAEIVKVFYKNCSPSVLDLPTNGFFIQKILDETGRVFPCEPLWYSVGELRDNDYNMDKILKSDEMKTFIKKIFRERCTCHWGLALSNALIYKPEYYPKILFEIYKIIARSIVVDKQKSEEII